MLDVARNSLINDILGLVSIPSVNGDEKGIKECFSYIKTIADRFGFESKICANGKVLEVYPHNMPIIPKIGIIVHVDTVPYTESDWIHNPLGEIADNRIWGRGVIDDKGAVILALHAMKELENQIKPDWKIIIGSCEEGSWYDMRDYLAEGNTIPGFIFTIDGDGIQNGCRGTLDVEMVFEAATSRPTIKEFKTPNGVINIIPDLVELQIGHSFKTVRGKAAHSSEPKNGINAIVSAFEEHKALFQEEYPGFAKFMDHYSWMDNALYIEKGSRTIINQEDPGTIATPTMVSMNNDKILLRVNTRLSPAINTRREVLTALVKARKEYECKISIKELIMPSYISRDNAELILMKKAYQEVIGFMPEVSIALGTGYNAAFPNAAIFGPRFEEVDEMDEDLCHCPNESRRIEDLEKFYEILKYYLKMSLAK